MRRHLLSAIVTLTSLPCFGAGFHALSLPGSQLDAMSADGRSAAGCLVGGKGGGFRWQEGQAPEILTGAMSVRAISPSGHYVAGSALDADQHEVAAFWDAEGVAHPIGSLPGADARAGVLSIAYGVTDQPRVVGMAVNAQRESTAFSWSAGDGLHALVSGAAGSGAVGISSDGRRIFGWSERADAARQGVLWNQGRVCCSVETGASANELVGANRSVTLLLGFTRDGLDGEVPYRWTPDTASTQMPFAIAAAAGPTRFTAGSDDAHLLVGATGTGAQRVAVVWTEQGGVERLDAFLADRGIAVPADWTLTAATAVSADGHRLAGFGLDRGHFDSFVIDLPWSVADTAARSRSAP